MKPTSLQSDSLLKASDNFRFFTSQLCQAILSVGVTDVQMILIIAFCFIFRIFWVLSCTWKLAIETDFCCSLQSYIKKTHKMRNALNKHRAQWRSRKPHGIVNMVGQVMETASAVT
jgi:hypothetical protein